VAWTSPNGIIKKRRTVVIEGHGGSGYSLRAENSGVGFIHMKKWSSFSKSYKIALKVNRQTGYYSALCVSGYCPVATPNLKPASVHQWGNYFTDGDVHTQNDHLNTGWSVHRYFPGDTIGIKLKPITHLIDIRMDFSKEPLSPAYLDYAGPRFNLSISWYRNGNRVHGPINVAHAPQPYIFYQFDGMDESLTLVPWPKKSTVEKKDDEVVFRGVNGGW